MPEAGEGAEALVALAARQRVLDVARTKTRADQERVTHELQAAGFNVTAFRIAVKRRGERAVGLPWQQLTPIPDRFRETVERYEAILMHADDQNKNAI